MERAMTASTVDGVAVDKLTATYLKIKNKRSELKAEFDEKDSDLKEKQEQIKRALLDYCKENNVESVRTEAGLFYRSIKTRYWTSDWDSIYKFVTEHNVPQLFAKSLNQTNVKQFLEENPDLMPKGLNIDNEYIVSVRKK
jgi:predicted metal-dependent phosphotriesterase family hydrolase